MLTIRTTVKPSPIHGLGVFTEHAYPKGVILWEFHPKFDTLFTPSEIQELPPEYREFVRHYGYLDQMQFVGFWVNHAGNDRFCNHSDNPTLVNEQIDGKWFMVASRDIQVEEELTCDFTAYEPDFRTEHLK